MFLLIDCNNFFVSCERVFRPDLRHRPVVVLSNNDGCVVSRSNEAKQLGIRMGIPVFKCKEIFEKHSVAMFSGNFPLYGDFSDRVMQVVKQFADEVEVYSIDEAFLWRGDMQGDDLIAFARTMRETIVRWTGIPVSVGIGSTKTLAKVANEWAKTHEEYNGVVSLHDSATHDGILQQLDIREVWGIGPRVAQYLRGYQVNTALELKQLNDAWVKNHLKTHGWQIVSELRGVACFEINTDRGPRKGILSSRSFGRPVTSLTELKEAVASYMTIASEKLRAQGSAATAVNVFLYTNRHRAEDKQYNRSRTLYLSTPTAYTPELITSAHTILESIYKSGFRYKKAGVWLTGLVPDTTLQTSLFDATYSTKQKRLMRAMDALNARWGDRTVQVAATGIKKNWKMRQGYRSPRYTTVWAELPTVQ